MPPQEKKVEGEAGDVMISKKELERAKKKGKRKRGRPKKEK